MRPKRKAAESHCAATGFAGGRLPQTETRTDHVISEAPTHKIVLLRCGGEDPLKMDRCFTWEV